jgi:hypothetical protein
VRDVVARRLGRLRPRAHAALALAAVLGLEFDLDALASAAAGDPFELLEALDEATEAGLVTPAPSGGHAFEHALVAETIISTLPAARRARLHLQVAEHLARRHRTGSGVRAGEVARHLRHARTLVAPERLVDWELAAAGEALGAPPRRAGPTGSAASNCSPSATRRTEPGGAPKPARAFAEAAALVRANDDTQLLAQAALGYGGLAVVITAPDPHTTSLLEKALAGVASGERAAAARLRARLAIELYYADPDRAHEHQPQEAASFPRIIR